ncbi:MAG: hypothetical protein ACTS6A_01600, partial [Candidatus Hodgkinia cicadicola]
FTRFRPLRRTTKVFNSEAKFSFVFVPTKQHYHQPKLASLPSLPWTSVKPPLRFTSVDRIPSQTASRREGLIFFL